MINSLTKSFFLPLLILLCAAGLINLYGISQSSGLSVFKKQLIWTFVGIVAMISISHLRPSTLRKHSFGIYLVLLITLGFVFLFGKTVSGSKSWFQMGPVSMQPSEFMKIGIIMAIANHYATDVMHRSSYSLADIAKPLAFLLLPTMAVVLQSDMGTSFVMFLTGSSMILLLGIRKRTIVGIAILVAISVLPVWHFVIKDYHKQRIHSFLDTSSDPLGISYNSIQSQIAIGSGMGYGKGFSLGSQSSLNFLPAHHTDFAFSVIGEEWGFRGSVFVLLLYFSIILFILITAMSLEDRFAVIACFGIAAMFFWHAAVNIAMITGLLPIIGTPLFFITYGGSSTLTAFMGIGVVLCLKKK